MGALSACDAESPSNPLVRVGSFVCEDPSVAERATAPWENAVTPLSRGPFRQENTFLVTERLILYRETIWSRTRIQGLTPPGMFGVAVPLRVGANTYWWGEALHENGLPAAMPGGCHAEISPGQQHLIVLIELGHFRDSIPEDLWVAIERATFKHLIPASRSGVARLGAALSALLDGAQANPRALHHPNAIRTMEQDLLAALRQSLTLPIPAPKCVGRAIRQRGLQRAVEYLRATDPGSVRVADLCSAACVTERTLQYAFREAFGLGPLGFLHLRRYHATRRDLLAADKHTATVRTIARYNGFYQTGRFATRYKALFGESPSVTLHRHGECIPRGLPWPNGFDLRVV